jgi:hypothetical protein
MLARTKLWCKGTKVSFLATYFCCTFVFVDFLYANSLFLLGILDGDAMDDIVDELGEDEITEESGKLFFLSLVLRQTIMIIVSITTCEYNISL